MPVYRYQLTMFDPVQAARQVPGAIVEGASGPQIYKDITAPSGSKADLDAYMATAGFTFISTDPSTTPGGQAGTDSGTVHVNVASEFSGVTEKTAPTDSDLLLIEDAAAANVKKKAKVSNLPAYQLKSATTVVDVSGAAAPSSGQVLTATGATAATWQASGASVVAPRTPVSANGVSITTTSTTPVLATGMTDTPPAGTYIVFFAGSVYQVNTGSGLYLEMSIYAGGTQAAESIRRDADSNVYDTPFCCIAIVTVNGSQAVEGRWRRSSSSVGTATMTGTRELILVRLT